ncbi:helix-turn-helix domain-containing protein [Metabacillus idriensis]|uniref:helix-turn-helix domain-containing protein n=1 Tax=Metabacillus idriensis TaxID=324768 RepID=UPI003D2D6DBB
MIGERIKSLRQKKGYSLSELAELSGVSKSYLSYIERDIQKNPSMQFLTKVAVSLGTDLEQLLAEDQDSKPKAEKQLDEEWTDLISEAIDQGLTKEDFRTFQDFIKFKHYKEKKKK